MKSRGLGDVYKRQPSFLSEPEVSVLVVLSEPALSVLSALEPELEPFGIIGIAPATPAVGTVSIAAAATPSANLETVRVRIGDKTYLYLSHL